MGTVVSGYTSCAPEKNLGTALFDNSRVLSESCRIFRADDLEALGHTLIWEGYVQKGLCTLSTEFDNAVQRYGLGRVLTGPLVVFKPWRKEVPNVVLIPFTAIEGTTTRCDAVRRYFLAATDLKTYADISRGENIQYSLRVRETFIDRFGPDRNLYKYEIAVLVPEFVSILELYSQDRLGFIKKVSPPPP